jgi:PST family polysaccharide transporter
MFRIFSVIHEDPERLRRAYRKVMMSASLLGFPIMTALAVMAPQVMVVMFGSQWRAAASPFSLMCAAGVLKLLNSYASAATQAAGLIWSEVWRQVLYTIMIVVGIVALSGWGPTGAAAAVLGATAVMSVLMHILLRRVTHLPWSEMARPLVPALMCSAGTASVVLLVEYALRSSGPEPNAWLLVACQVPAAALFVLSFVLFVPHRELRAVVLEMANTLAPNSVKRHRWAKAYLEAHAGAAVEPGSA